MILRSLACATRDATPLGKSETASAKMVTGVEPAVGRALAYLNPASANNSIAFARMSSLLSPKISLNSGPYSLYFSRMLSTSPLAEDAGIRLVRVEPAPVLPWSLMNWSVVFSPVISAGDTATAGFFAPEGTGGGSSALTGGTGPPGIVGNSLFVGILANNSWNCASSSGERFAEGVMLLMMGIDAPRAVAPATTGWVTVLNAPATRGYCSANLEPTLPKCWVSVGYFKVCSAKKRPPGPRTFSKIPGNCWGKP